MKKSGFLTFCFAFIPGAGQMYQGYMKRGLSLITFFCMGIFLSSIFPYAAAVLPIIWMYSFFDTFNLNHTVQSDAFLLQNEWICTIKDSVAKKPTWIGGGLILLGLWILFDSFINPLLYHLAKTMGIDSWYYTRLYEQIPTLALAVVIIYLGFRLAFGKNQHPTNEVQDFEEFRGERFDNDNIQ